MQNYLKIIFAVVFITVVNGVVTVRADTTQPTATPTPATQPPMDSSSNTVVAAQPATSSTAYYNYACDEAEYNVMLPEAPKVMTIWQASPATTPFLQDPPTGIASLGEVATFKRVDIDTEEAFNVKITFLKAKQSFLQGLTEDKIKEMLTNQYTGVTLANEKFDYSTGTGTVKWATLSGFTIVPHQPPSFTAIHYLTGLQSILVVQVTYSVENKTYQDYYNKLVSSITYVAP